MRCSGRPRRWATQDRPSPEGVAFVLDLSERKRAEEGLRELESDFAHMNRLSMMGELAASLAHEILHPRVVTSGHTGASKVALTLAHFFAGGAKRTVPLTKPCCQIDRRRKID